MPEQSQARSSDSVLLEPSVTRKDASPGKFHIYDVGSDVALCGHRCNPDTQVRPPVRGPWDCDVCWDLHLADPAELGVW